jgi:hypothetical protein
MLKLLERMAQKIGVTTEDDPVFKFWNNQLDPKSWSSRLKKLPSNKGEVLKL